MKALLLLATLFAGFCFAQEVTPKPTDYTAKPPAIPAEKELALSNALRDSNQLQAALEASYTTQQKAMQEQAKALQAAVTSAYDAVVAICGSEFDLKFIPTEEQRRWNFVGKPTCVAKPPQPKK